jgi:peroxiredoxin
MDDFADYYRVLRATDGKTYQLASYKGKQPVVLFFYPKAATPGCTKEVRTTFSRRSSTCSCARIIPA